MGYQRCPIKRFNFAQACKVSTKDMAKMLGMGESKVVELKEGFQKTSSLHLVRGMVAVSNQK